MLRTTPPSATPSSLSLPVPALPCRIYSRVNRCWKVLALEPRALSDASQLSPVGAMVATITAVSCCAEAASSRQGHSAALLVSTSVMPVVRGGVGGWTAVGCPVGVLSGAVHNRQLLIHTRHHLQDQSSSGSSMHSKEVHPMLAARCGSPPHGIICKWDASTVVRAIQTSYCLQAKKKCDWYGILPHLPGIQCECCQRVAGVHMRRQGHSYGLLWLIWLV